MCFTDDKIVNTAEELKVASFFCSEDRGNTSLHKDVTFYSFPFPGLCVVTVVCILLFVVGIVGNIMTILIISKSRNMRTTTNLYLSSIALSDVLILLCMPLDLYKMWNFRPWRLGDMVCKLSQYVSEACTYSTVLHITALSMERYLAVCYPLQVKVIITRTKIKWLIVMLWAVALSSAGPVFVLVGVEFENGTDPAETGECKCTSYAVTSGLLNIMMWVSSLYFFVPVCCLSLLYSLIGKKLWRRRRRHRNRSNTQTVKMLAVIVLAFVLCWLPFHVGRNLLSIASGTSEMYVVAEYFSLLSCVLFYLSAAINPVLYNTMSARYRASVCRMLRIRHCRTMSRHREWCTVSSWHQSVNNRQRQHIEL